MITNVTLIKKWNEICKNSFESKQQWSQQYSNGNVLKNAKSINIFMKQQDNFRSKSSSN